MKKTLTFGNNFKQSQQLLQFLHLQLQVRNTVFLKKKLGVAQTFSILH